MLYRSGIGWKEQETTLTRSTGAVIAVETTEPYLIIADWHTLSRYDTETLDILDVFSLSFTLHLPVYSPKLLYNFVKDIPLRFRMKLH